VYQFDRGYAAYKHIHGIWRSLILFSKSH
jgi:hypothetical protein